MSVTWTNDKIASLPATALIAGIDEVGRGALFGPVVAAAVVVRSEQLPLLTDAGIRDSKQLSAARRVALVPAIEAIASAWQIRQASVREIDRLNILSASLLAMERCVRRLSIVPDLCLVDGNQPIPGLMLPQTCLVGGDLLSPVIAAASILAKVWRDRLIERLASRYPGYDLAANKGYGTAKHRQALMVYGPTFQHRRSFRLGSNAN